MMKRGILAVLGRASLVAAATLLSGQGHGMAAEAASLLEGRYLAQLFSPSDESLPSYPHENAAIRLGGLMLSFTPRDAFAGETRTRLQDDLPTLRFSLTGAADEARTLDLLEFADRAPPHLTRAQAGSAARSFRLGGAFEWHDWSIGGSIVRLDDDFGGTGMVGADVGYGRFGASLAFGQTEDVFSQGEREFWLFSTNLAARPWLSLEGDVGYTPAQTTDPSSAVGRVGVRLRF